MDPESEAVVDEPTPDTGTPAEQEPQTDWEKRYGDLQPEYTRATQELAQYRQHLSALQSENADDRIAAAEALGLQLAEEDVEEYDDTQSDPVLAQRLAKLEAQLQQQTQAQQDQQRLAVVEATVETQLAALPGLEDADRDWIVSRAVNLPATADGMPDIAKAHQEYQALEAVMKKRWAETKRAPRVPGNGTSGTQQPDLDDPEQRVAWMAERMTDTSQ